MQNQVIWILSHRLSLNSFSFFHPRRNSLSSWSIKFDPPLPTDYTGRLFKKLEHAPRILLRDVGTFSSLSLSLSIRPLPTVRNFRKTSQDSEVSARATLPPSRSPYSLPVVAPEFLFSLSPTASSSTWGWYNPVRASFAGRAKPRGNPSRRGCRKIDAPLFSFPKSLPTNFLASPAKVSSLYYSPCVGGKSKNISGKCKRLVCMYVIESGIACGQWCSSFRVRASENDRSGGTGSGEGEGGSEGREKREERKEHPLSGLEKEARGWEASLEEWGWRPSWHARACADGGPFDTCRRAHGFCSLSLSLSLSQRTVSVDGRRFGFFLIDQWFLRLFTRLNL